MPIPRAARTSYLGRQIGGLALAQVRIASPMAAVRAASWHNTALRLGARLPLFVVHDVGLLLTAPRGEAGWVLADAPSATGAGEAATAAVHGYRELISLLADSEVPERARGLHLSDEVVALVIVRLLGDVARLATPWADLAEVLPLDPSPYGQADRSACFSELDPAPLLRFLERLSRHAWHVYVRLEQVDLDTLRLLGVFRAGRLGGEAWGEALELPDLFQLLGSPEANDVVNFSLELLPSVLETRRATGAQAFSFDGYASIERRGSPDALVVSELAWDQDLFEQKVIDRELFYYAHEREREAERRLHYLLVDSSASMRGQREVFARGLALALAKKLLLRGDDAWLRFFDSRLHDIVDLGRAGARGIPYLLGFRSERGRNYGKAFRQLVLELARMKRASAREIVVHLITHGQCHVPVPVVAALGELAFIDAVFILPSSEVTLEYLPLLHRKQLVTAEALATRKGRMRRALDIIGASGQARA